MFAQSSTWTFAGATGTWQTPANWSGSGLPDGTVHATFAQGAAYTVSFAADAQARDLSVNDGTVTFDLAGHALTATGTLLMNAPGSRLALNDGTLNAAGCRVSASGAVTVNAGARLNVPDAQPLGISMSYIGGTLVINGGMITARSLKLPAPTSLQFTDGTITFDAGNFSATLGDVTVRNGSSSQTSTNSWDVSSPTGLATVQLVNGATATFGSANFFVGNSAAHGALSVDASTLTISNSGGALLVGYQRNAAGTQAGEGTLTIVGGGRISAQWRTLIGAAGGTGRATVSGANSALTAANAAVEVGSSRSFAPGQPIAHGTLVVNDGGRVAGNGITVGIDGAQGVVSVSGTLSRLDAGSGTMQIGTFDRGEGTLLVSANGEARTTSNLRLGVGGGTGFAHLSSGGSLSVGQTLNVGVGEFGRTGVGSLVLDSAAQAHSTTAQVGAFGATGSLLLADSKTAWSNSGSVDLGNDGSGLAARNGTGTISITSGASASIGGRLKVWSGGTVNYGSGSLVVGTLDVSGGHVLLTSGGDKLLRTGAVSTSLGGLIDLADDDLLVTGNTSPQQVIAQIVTARNAGAWDGAGITSSAARNQSSHATGLGVLTGAEYTALAGTNTFDGITVGSVDVVVKYTWNGDANLSGTVSFDDYVRIDTGFNTHLTGWANGDFNYDGAVNFDDYVLIDIAFNAQSATLGRAIDWISGDDRSGSGRTAAGVEMLIAHFEQFGSAYAQSFLASIPEPTVLSLGSVAMLAQRRRRRHRIRAARVR